MDPIYEFYKKLKHSKNLINVRAFVGLMDSFLEGIIKKDSGRYMLAKAMEKLPRHIYLGPVHVDTYDGKHWSKLPAESRQKIGELLMECAAYNSMVNSPAQ